MIHALRLPLHPCKIPWMKINIKPYNLCLFIHTTTVKKLLCFVIVVVDIQYSVDCQ